MDTAKPETQTVPSRRGRWLKRAGLTLAALLAVQFATYLGCANAAMPQSGITHLRDYDCIRGDEYAAIDRQTWEALDAGQRKALEGELRRHVPVIYHSRDEIPDSGKDLIPLTEQDRRDIEDRMKRPGVSPETVAALKKVVESGQKEIGLNKGILFSWKQESRGLFWTKCSSGCYMGNAGAEGRVDAYVWILFRWVRVRNYCHVMA